MKRSEFLTTVINRQNRVVYTLLVVTAAIGLAWVLWRHQYLAALSSPAPLAVPTAAAR